MEAPDITRQRAEFMMLMSPEAPYAFVKAGNGLFFVLNHGTTDDGADVNMTVIGKVIE